jgi:hypothetical protein
MKILLITAGYSIFDAKGQLNGFLSYLTDNHFSKKGYKVKISDVTKDTWDVDREVDKLLWADVIIYITPIMWFNMPAPLVKWLDEVLLPAVINNIFIFYSLGPAVTDNVVLPIVCLLIKNLINAEVAFFGGFKFSTSKACNVKT